MAAKEWRAQPAHRRNGAVPQYVRLRAAGRPRGRPLQHQAGPRQLAVDLGEGQAIAILLALGARNRRTDEMVRYLNTFGSGPLVGLAALNPDFPRNFSALKAV
ncbi:hypothetical protein LB543_22550 [Mesorhizobium sp. ESP7-2]|uniref:hypothetical protein n=1 Tax=Mesorhizobium sp. ESP7-2 TaxID=2876622 RepID=UPI001CC97058|nr:hypothetical protein [Mesorhizobium sp. ESP7-2]MBZ9709503.1 hypothetical protein [Mesorhizobium sp. ESP7-2]